MNAGDITQSPVFVAVKKGAFGFYGLALLCFLLPFVTISCQGQPLAKMTGVQLALGDEIITGRETAFGQTRTQTQEIEPYPSATIAAGAGALGLIAGFVNLLKRRISNMVGDLVMAGLGAGALIWLAVVLKMEVSEAARREGAPFILEFGVGYGLALLSFGAVMAVAILDLVLRRAQAAAAAVPLPMVGASPVPSDGKRADE